MASSSSTAVSQSDAGAGYTLIQVKTREESLEWSRRYPNPVAEGADAEIEVRRLFELEDFGPSDAVDRFREMGTGSTSQ